MAAPANEVENVQDTSRAISESTGTSTGDNCFDNSTKITDIEGGPGSKDQAQFPLWKLALAAIPWIGVQALWSTEFAVTTPYMKDLGLSDAMSSNIWIFGPITGFITAPVVGYLSDRCESRYGRRRPFIICGLVLLWAASLIFAGSRYIVPEPFSKWLAFTMFIVLDITINVIQTPIRAIVSDMASNEQQMHGQIISVLFQGIGTFLGFGIMLIWEVPFQHIFPLMILILSILTVFVGIQLLICKETPYVRPDGAPAESILSPFKGAFNGIFYMSADLAKIAFVQFFSWYSLFCYWPTLSTWFSLNVLGGNADAPHGSVLNIRYEQGQQANSMAGLCNAGLMIAFSMVLIALMLKSSVPLRYIYAACLYVGAVALVLAKFMVGHSVLFAKLIVTIMAIPICAVNAFPFALVGAMNKKAQAEGRTPDTGVQMGVLNIFVCVPQLVATLVIGALRAGNAETALPWAFLMAGVSFAVAGTGAFFLNDAVASKSALQG